MGRYRPAAPTSSPYITPQGHQGLQQELQKLWKHRADVTRALASAAAEGDRSENAEYIYRKKELREIDRRLRYLQKRLPELKVVSSPPSRREQIFFGAWVNLLDADGRERIYRIVGADEFDTARGWISMDSPLARALMRKTVDDEVVVQTPGGSRYYLIIGVRYAPPS
jgi:transcription elongation factor GreB